MVSLCTLEVLYCITVYTRSVILYHCVHYIPDMPILMKWSLNKCTYKLGYCVSLLLLTLPTTK